MRERLSEWKLVWKGSFKKSWKRHLRKADRRMHWPPALGLLPELVFGGMGKTFESRAAY